MHRKGRQQESRPPWARELKLDLLLHLQGEAPSRPPWARELKHFAAGEYGKRTLSRPPWARELKQFLLDAWFNYRVAPPVGA